MSDQPEQASEPDAAAIGAALLLADLHEAVAEATAQLAALSSADAGRATAILPAPLAVETASSERAEGGPSLPEAPPKAAARVGDALPRTEREASQAPFQSVLPDAPERVVRPIGSDGEGGLAGPALTAREASSSFVAVSPGRPVASAPVLRSAAPPLVGAAPTAASGARSPASGAAGAAAPGSSWSVSPSWNAAPAASSSLDAPQPASPSDARWPAAAAPGTNPAAPVGPSLAAPSAVPPASAQASGPTGGDVFLDGHRVGRWLADTLAHEAGGPAMGGTAFDPRLGPTWPGALQGNGA